MISRIALCWSQELAQRVIEHFPKVVKGRAARVYGDVLNLESLQQANETIKSEFGAVDILINAAGGNHPSATTKPDLSFFDLSFDALRHAGDLNLLGTILPCQVFGRGMAECGEGRDQQFHAVAGGPHGAELLAAHPCQRDRTWIFVGEQNRRLLLNEDGTLTSRGQSILAHTPMNRFGIPEDLLGAVLWLVSPASALVTGAVIPIDGGFSAFSGV